jgi:hypothetical protein
LDCFLLVDEGVAVVGQGYFYCSSSVALSWAEASALLQALLLWPVVLLMLGKHKLPSLPHTQLALGRPS